MGTCRLSHERGDFGAGPSEHELPPHRDGIHRMHANHEWVFIVFQSPAAAVPPPSLVQSSAAAHRRNWLHHHPHNNCTRGSNSSFNIAVMKTLAVQRCAAVKCSLKKEPVADAQSMYEVEHSATARAIGKKPGRQPQLHEAATNTTKTSQTFHTVKKFTATSTPPVSTGPVCAAVSPIRTRPSSRQCSALACGRHQQTTRPPP